MHRLVSTSLYFVSIGSSDYLHNYLLPDSKFAEQYSAQEFQDMLISSLSQHLKVRLRIALVPAISIFRTISTSSVVQLLLAMPSVVLV